MCAGLSNDAGFAMFDTVSWVFPSIFLSIENVWRHVLKHVMGGARITITKIITKLPVEGPFMHVGVLSFEPSICGSTMISLSTMRRFKAWG